MQHWEYDRQSRRDGITIPTIWVAVALSLLLHLAVMWHWLPQLKFPSLEVPQRDELVVRLSPPPGPPASTPAPHVAPPAPHVSPPPRPASAARPAPPPRPPAAPRPAAPPPVIAANTPRPDARAPAATAPAPSTPAPARPPAAMDLASYIEARRAARADAAPAAPVSAPPEDDKARSNRIAAANLAQRPLAFGYDPTKSGGIFEIKRMSYYDAEFMFYGWNSEVRHNTAQLIEVSKGNNSDIRLAVVRRMIAIIRQFEQEDFEWSSRRLRRDVTLSARVRDSAGLEDFLMQEFFPDATVR